MSKKLKQLQEMAEILSIAITRKRASVQYYTYAYEKATTETLRKMFSLMIEQEKGHEALLRTQLHEIQSEIEAERKKSKRA